MEHCVALLIARSLLKNGAPSGMALCGSCMPLVWAIVATGLLPSTVSRKPRKPQASAGECGVVAALLLSLDLLSHTPRRACTAASCSSILERLAPLWHSARMAQSGSQRNRSPGKLHPALVCHHPPENVLTRARRAHWRLSWAQRLARNARPTDAPRLSITLHGLPATFAHAFGFELLATA
jgi:hypothetical protein